VAVDESHLLGTVSARLEYVLEVLSDRNWCVTATPMVSSFTDLNKQIEFLFLDKESKAQPTTNILQKVHDSAYKGSAYQWRSRLMPPRINKNRQNGYND
jgi:hypothetical protein